MEFKQGSRVVFCPQIDLGRGIWYGRRCLLKKSSCWGVRMSICWEVMVIGFLEVGK